MKYRIADLNDLPRLLELEQSVVEAERPFNSDIKAGTTFYYDIEKLISSDDAYLVVADEGGEIVGSGYAQIKESKPSLEHDIHAYLGFMYVSVDFRRKGINKKILELLVDWSNKKGAKHIYLEVYSQNSSAIRVYEKAGFTPCVMEMKLNLE